MPKDSFLVGTPPSHSSAHLYSSKKDKKYDQIELTKLIGRGTFRFVVIFPLLLPC
jgi:hypothetical protein